MRSRSTVQKFRLGLVPTHWVMQKIDSLMFFWKLKGVWPFQILFSTKYIFWLRKNWQQQLSVLYFSSHLQISFSVMIRDVRRKKNNWKGICENTIFKSNIAQDLVKQKWEKQIQILFSFAVYLRKKHISSHPRALWTWSLKSQAWGLTGPIMWP